MSGFRHFCLIFAMLVFGSLYLPAACTPGATNPSITMCTPVSGGTYGTTLNVTAATTDSHTISAIWVYVDNVNVYKSANSPTLNVNITVATGAHNVRLQAWDSTGALLQAGANITVANTPPPVSVAISPTGATLLVNATQQFTARVSNTTNTGVTWSVDGVAGGNATTGTVSVSGLYTAPAQAGSHTVKATSVADTAKSASASVSVVTQMANCTPATSPAAKICSPANGSTVTSPVHVVVGTADTHRISAINTYVDNVVVNKTYAGSVDTTVNVAAGNHVLRVQAWDTTGTIYRDSVNITVSAGPPTTTVTVSPGSATLAGGGTQQFSATVLNNADTSVTWSVDGVAGGNATAGTVDASGLYTAPSAAGSHTVTATSVADSAKSGTASVTVTAPPNSVTVLPRRAVITMDQTSQFTANTGVNWSVDGVAGGNATVGTISTNGLYSPPAAAGPHQITATMATDVAKTASAVVYVNNSPGVFTYHNDNARTGQNTSENTLSPANVNQGQFGKLFSRTLDGFVFAQPLYVQGLTVGGAKHNVVFVATQHCSVYAFDADGNGTAPLWKRSFINPAAGINPVTGAEVGNYDMGPEAGITGTPVIDPASGTLYVVVRTNENGTYVQRLHAVSLTTGADKATSAPIAATVNGSGVGGDGAGHIPFDPKMQNQRAALLLANGKVYVAWGAHGDLGAYHGWMMSFDAATLQKSAVYNVTPNGKDGGIWMSGAGPSADAAGDIYLSTGNGTNDTTGAAVNISDSYMKLSPALAPMDYFTPYDQQTLNAGDLDLGASGLVLLPDQPGAHPHIMVGGGKRGDMYVVDRDNLGGFHAGSNSNIVQYFPRALGVNTANDQFFGTGSYWNGNMYFVGAFDHLKQFSVSNGLLSTSPIHISQEALSSNRSAEPVVSANGSSNGIVWVLATDTYQAGSPAILHAYDATDVSTELYTNAQAGTRDLGGKVVKFTTPTVINGRVYVGTRSQLDVYGLLP